MTSSTPRLHCGPHGRRDVRQLLPPGLIDILGNGEDVSRPGTVTTLLARAREGDREALSALIDTVYSESRRIAVSYLRRERPGHTLQPTALVHEAYLRLAGQSIDRQNRTFFEALDKLSAIDQRQGRIVECATLAA